MGIVERREKKKGKEKPQVQSNQKSYKPPISYPTYLKTKYTKKEKQFSKFL